MQLTCAKKNNLGSVKKAPLATNLSNLLLKNHLSINQLAKQLNLPMMTLRRLLSGETIDPRISTLKLIANYFNIPVDLLINAHATAPSLLTASEHTYAIPHLSWENLAPWCNNLHDVAYWLNLKSITLHHPTTISSQAFALESRPSMYARFPKNTIFIFDANIQATDGDLVIVKLKNESAFTLREIALDPPHTYCLPINAHATLFQFSASKHEIIGVNLLTMLYNKSGDRS